MAKAVDAHEVFELAGVLAVAGEVAMEDAKPIVKRGANNIKTDWRKRATGIEHAPHYPRAITYEVTEREFNVEAEIGPLDQGPGEKKQGFLGPILEFGGAHNHPMNHGGESLDAEEPKFVEELAKVAGRTI